MVIILYLVQKHINTAGRLEWHSFKKDMNVESKQLLRNKRKIVSYVHVYYEFLHNIITRRVHDDDKRYLWLNSTYITQSSNGSHFSFKIRFIFIIYLLFSFNDKIYNVYTHLMFRWFVSLFNPYLCTYGIVHCNG